MGKEPIFSVGQQYTVIEQVTASRLMFSGRCILYSVCLSGVGDSVSCQVYDSRTATGKEVLHLEAKREVSIPWVCPAGALMEKGIYLAVSAEEAQTTITYSPLEKKSFRGE